MRDGRRWLISGALLLAGCAAQPRSDEAAAIDLCGSVGKLQAANTYYLNNVDSLVVDGKFEQRITYPELTPQLRASAMRSTAHCINLRLGAISEQTYDRLMALEATSAAAAENALTHEQVEALIGKGYTRVAEILRKAGVSEKAIAQVAATTTAELPPAAPATPSPSLEMQTLAEISGKVNALKPLIDAVPGEVAKAVNASRPPARTERSIATLLFAPRAATLDAAARLALHKSVSDIGPEEQLSVVGSADANGDALRNLELSRQRAQSVAVWLMVHRGVEPRRIHVSARGAGNSTVVSSEDRSVTIYSY